jgi:repressor of nif and glnA expression
MKRDWEVIRAILIGMEDLGDTNSSLSPGDVGGFDSDTVAYHMRILSEAGLIQAEVIDYVDGEIHCRATRLTWEGHQFLDNMRDQQTWNRVKRTIREKGLEISFEAIKIAGTAVVQRMLGS